MTLENVLCHSIIRRVETLNNNIIMRRVGRDGGSRREGNDDHPQLSNVEDGPPRQSRPHLEEPHIQAVNAVSAINVNGSHQEAQYFYNSALNTPERPQSELRQDQEENNLNLLEMRNKTKRSSKSKKIAKIIKRSNQLTAQRQKNKRLIGTIRDKARQPCERWQCQEMRNQYLRSNIMFNSHGSGKSQRQIFLESELNRTQRQKSKIQLQKSELIIRNSELNDQLVYERSTKADYKMKYESHYGRNCLLEVQLYRLQHKQRENAQIAERNRMRLKEESSDSEEVDCQENSTIIFQ